MFGLLPVDKPSGITSRQAVDVVKKLIRPTKIGHSGTLDPLASGILVLCIGPATRLASFVQSLPKSYIGGFQLGYTSDSDDINTPLVPVHNSPGISESDLASLLPDFVGDVAQTPPNYSAIKINGQRAYRLSRAGQSLDIKPRTVSIYSIELLEFNYPHFKLKIECGSGTYIRSLGRDIGSRLQSGVVMTSLVRTAVGIFDLANAIKTDAIDLQQLNDRLINPVNLFQDDESVVLDESQYRQLIDGHIFTMNELQIHSRPKRIVAKDRTGNLLALLTCYGHESYKPELNFARYYLPTH